MLDHLVDVVVTDDDKLKEMLEALKTLNIRCRLLADNKGLTLDNAVLFSESAAQVKMLLILLDQHLMRYMEQINILENVPRKLEVEQDNCQNRLLSIRHLKGQFGELEGILKEARNDLQKKYL